jgi:hypothetical protein
MKPLLIILKKLPHSMCYSHFGNEVCISIRQRGFINDHYKVNPVGQWGKILAIAMGFVDHLGHYHFKGTSKKNIDCIDGSNLFEFYCLVMQMGGEGMQNGFLSCLAISFRADHSEWKSETLFKEKICNLTYCTIDKSDEFIRSLNGAIDAQYRHMV